MQRESIGIESVNGEMIVVSRSGRWTWPTVLLVTGIDVTENLAVHEGAQLFVSRALLQLPSVARTSNSTQ